MQQNSHITQLLTPLAIVLGFAMVAGALLLTNAQPQNGAVQLTAAGAPPSEPAQPAGPQIALRAELDEDEHILGNPDAEVFIVEYSDIDCPFCARLHPTLEAVVENSDGRVAWAYRHFPLEQLHPDAARKAAATECVSQLAGAEAFWPYLDGLFNGALVGSYSDYGISEADFTACMEDPAIAAAVNEDIERALAAGGSGTPYSVVATREHGLPVSGAQPEAVWLQVVDSLLES